MLIDGVEWDGKTKFNAQKHHSLTAKVRPSANDTSLYYAKNCLLTYVFVDGIQGWYGGGPEAAFIEIVKTGIGLYPNISDISESNEYHHKMIKQNPKVLGLQIELPYLSKQDEFGWIQPVENTKLQVLHILLSK